MKTRNSYIKYIAGLLLFGSNGTIASFIHLQSYQIVYLRTFLGAALLLIVLFASRRALAGLKNPGDLLRVIISGAAMGVGWLFLFEAYTRIGVGLSSLLYYCGPVIVIALSPVLFKEKIGLRKLPAFAVVLVGIFLVIGIGSDASFDTFGILCGAASAVLLAVLVISNKLNKTVSGIENSTVQLTTAFLVAAVYTIIKSGPVPPLATSDILPVVVLGLVNTGFGCYLYFSSIGNLRVQTVAVLGYLEPLSAVVFSMVFLGEPMSALQVLGAACIIGGAMYCELGGGKRKV